MKKSFLFTLLIFISAFSALKASHYYGIDMRYEHLGGCNYRIYQNLYYDCGGASMNGYLPPNVTYPMPASSVSIVGNGCGLNMSPNNWVLDTLNYKDITPVCPGTSTACTSGSGYLFNGVVQVTYYTDISLCGLSCPSVSVIFTNCCRNYAITSGAGGGGIYSEMVIPLNIGANNSPQFMSPPITYISVGGTSTIQQAAFDADGDSLVYSIVPSLQAAGQNVTYNAGFSPISPLGPTWNISINSHTGEVVFSPQPGTIQVGIIGIKVEEYRNNLLIGSINRDVQVAIVNNPTGSNLFPTSTISNVNGANYSANPNKFKIFPNIPFGFDIVISDGNWLDSIYYSSDFQNFMPTANLTNLSGTSVNPLILHFSWTPSLNDIGKHIPFVINARDNKCSMYGSNDIFAIIEVDSVNLNATTTTSACTFPSGSVDFTMTGGVPPYTFSWNNGATTEDLVNVPTGAYWVTVTDAFTNVWYSDTFYVNPDSVFASYTLTNPHCNAADGEISVIMTGGQTPYTYAWSNGQNGAILTNVGIGGYSFTVTDALGCYFHDAVLLDYLPTDSCFSRISGKVYFDANQNCTQDVLEMGLSNILVQLNNGTYCITDANGDYSFIVTDTGTYHLQCYFNAAIPSSSNCTTIPFNSTSVISSLGQDSLNNDFAIHFSADISVILYEGNYLPGFTHSGNIYCHNLSYYNLTNATVTYQHDSLFVNPVFTPTPTSYNAATYTATWVFPNFNVGAVRYIHFHGQTSLTASLGDTVKTYVNILPVIGDYLTANNQDTFARIVVGSYDPNNKEVFPQGQTQFGLIPPNTQKLNYVINFQNTGNYPAQFVVLRDTIDINKLEISSLSMEISSHACTLKVEENSILIATFADIDLPDSTSDEPNSHGFVEFSLKLKPNLPLNTPVKNHASIYFDFNAPVPTNAVMSTLYAPMQLSVSVDSVICPTDSLAAMVTQGNPPYHFSWSNGVQISGNTSGISQVAPNFAAGSQSVRITDAFGMSVSQTFQANVQAIADANFTYYHIGNDYGFTPNSAQNTTYNWNFGNGQTSTLASPFVTYTQSGAYNVSLIVADNCGGIDTFAQTVYVALTDVDAAFVLGAKLSPNPFDATCTLSFENPEHEVYELIIRDLNGKVVQKITDIRAAEVKILRENKAAGAYIWELKGKREARGLMVIE